MDIWYWISEYGKVFCGYLFLIFLWPSVVFRNHLRTKSKVYYFSFCVTVPIVIINMVVLTLGIFHGLTQWGICLIFYGVFILAFLKNIISYLDRRYKRLVDAKFHDVRTLKGKYRSLVLIILFFMVCVKYVKKAARFLSFDYIKRIKSCNWSRVRIRIKGCIWDIGQKISFLFWKYGIAAIVIIYGMVYFSYGAFQIHSYGYGDLYVHHGWIYGLIEGRIFPEGIYPEAMHCFIYCMHTLFGIKVHSILLFLQGIHAAVFLLSVYLLLRKVFYWQYTPVFVLMLFLTLDLCNADLIHSMFRLQITLPMEFGLHTVCLAALYLINYLNSDHNRAVGRKGRPAKFNWNEDLFLFMMILAAAVMTHFHLVVMAGIICISFAVFALKKICNIRNLVPLTATVLAAVLITAAPMAGAFAQGVPFNSSIEWAVNAISGDESREYRRESAEINDPEESGNEEAHPEILRNEISFTAALLKNVIELYDKGYAALYGKSRGGWMFLLVMFTAVFCWLAVKKEKLKHFREVSLRYPPLIMASVLYVFTYAAPMFGLPDILPEGRFFAPGHMMLLAVMVIPADILLFELLRFGRELLFRILSLLSIPGIYGTAILTGTFRGFLFYELSQYNAAAEVTESIIETFPQYSYTIVSPTDELYPVIQHGWHEELLSFVENCSSAAYTLPSEYVFIYVEKKPILYAQSHFFQGPFWMGEEKYLEPFWKMYSLKYEDSGASQSPDVITAQVSQEKAERELPAYESAWSMYLKLENRTVLESKAYEWCQRFARENPSVLNVYYEDEDFVCYYFRQKAGQLPYELGIGEENE